MNSKEPEPWRVGVLFSRSGVTSITESEHFFGTALAIEEINADGGVLGRQIAPVAYDPGGDNSAYRALARELLTEEELSVIFGCSTSASRKAVLPIVERHNGLLVYPSMYEGFEYSENVIYTGATLNQNTFALADYLLQRYGRRVYLVGADYIYPRESNRVMRDLIESKGGEVVAERYIPLDAGTAELTALVDEIERLAPDAVFSTVIGTSAQEFYSLYDARGIDRSQCPIASLTMAESEIRAIGWEKCTGHILAASYFQSIDSDANRRFVMAYKSRFGEGTNTSVWSQPAYAQVHMFARALERVGSMDGSKLAAAMLKEEMDAPEGKLFFDEDTRHIWVTPRIGVLGDGGLFDIVWEAPAAVRPDPYLVTSRFDETWLSGEA
ncbi:transporter substrate-binding domain-containing protein [Devosia sp. SL43]|uniref:transporter substrate-binding domain-containing protein n=1 Tax=Devosia sp. SL43 TaxID=2806348 RepID=UPI001F1A2578|nr:transporter substrate-binding protein [Devosia sp. SL43]UJW84865.1 transporter substrate-binding domain-containing protein [Devosia sp. SL43]